MPSPFPGMNPYLERQSTWDSFHNHFLVECLRRLVPVVGEKYTVLAGTRIYIHEPSASERRYFAQADIGITSSETRAAGATVTATKSSTRYRTIPFCVVPEKVTKLEIRDAQGDSLVTAIELLSRTNKLPANHRDQFQAKREEIIRGDAHYVEINLLRAGTPLPFEPPLIGPYYAAVSRVEDRKHVSTWEWGIRDEMPEVPIPLRVPDTDVLLDLKSVLDRVYDEGGYAHFLGSRLPDPPLSPEDEAWAKSLIAAGS